MLCHPIGSSCLINPALQYLLSAVSKAIYTFPVFDYTALCSEEILSVILLLSSIHSQNKMICPKETIWNEEDMYHDFIILILWACDGKAIEICSTKT